MSAPVKSDTTEETALVVVEPRGRLELRVSEDRMSIVLDAEDPLANLPDTLSRIDTAWQELGLPEPFAADTLTSILQANCRPGEDTGPLILRRGTPSIKPVDGRLEWAEDFFCGGFEVDTKTDRMDFWERIDHRSVTEDQLLVTVLDPVEGTPGEDVFGVTLKVVKTKSAKIRLGKGVHEKPVEGGKGVFASCHGKVGFGGGTVSVENVLLIRGDVCLETGNIHHHGHVQIEGDVREGASIETQGEVEVKGMLEPCNIKAGGDLKVGGGIVSEEGYTIRVGGNLQARYIHQASLRVEGNVLVMREIAHSNIEALGKVDVSEGRIAGGRTLARKGIFVAEAGAHGTADTELVAGFDPTLEPRLQQIRNRKAELENARGRILAALQRHPAGMGTLTPQQEKLVVDLRSKVKVIEAGIEESDAQFERARQDSAQQAHPEVVIYREVHAGTRIQLAEYKTKVRVTIHKPRIARIRHKTVQILPMGEGNTPEDES